MSRRTGLPERKDLVSLGYREEICGAISWLVKEAGSSFLGTKEDWSGEKLALNKWNFWDKGSHALYLTKRDADGRRFLVKIYQSTNRAGFFSRPTNKAKNEFTNTVIAYRDGFNTVLPLAFGEDSQDLGWGVLVYPFLENAVTLEEAYPYKGREGLPLSERRYFEKRVGELLRRCMDTGIFPANMCLGHFLAKKEEGERLEIYWVDFEKVKFKVFFREKYAVKNLAKLLARMEWLRASGSKMSRSSAMRIVYPCLHKNGFRELDKRLCRAIIRAAREYWEYRSLDGKGLYPLTSIQPFDQGGV